MDFPDNSFDMVWACESGEHMPDKKAYVAEMVGAGLAVEGHRATRATVATCHLGVRLAAAAVVLACRMTGASVLVLRPADFCGHLTPPACPEQHA
jgi:hypothetical protein